MEMVSVPVDRCIHLNFFSVTPVSVSTLLGITQYSTVVVTVVGSYITGCLTTLRTFLQGRTSV